MLIIALYGVAYVATKALEKGTEVYRDRKEGSFRPVVAVAPAWGSAPETRQFGVLTPSEFRHVEALITAPERAALAKEAWS